MSSSNNLSTTPLKKGKNNSVMKVEASLQKEAKLKYASFMLGNVQINELDKSKLS